MADQGAKVIHPKAVDFSKEGEHSSFYKNTLSESKGTLISNDIMCNERRYITGITYLNNRIQVRIRLSENSNIKAYQSLLSILAKNHISLDLINIFPAHQFLQ